MAKKSRAYSSMCYYLNYSKRHMRAEERRKAFQTVHQSFLGGGRQSQYILFLSVESFIDRNGKKSSQLAIFICSDLGNYHLPSVRDLWSVYLAEIHWANLIFSNCSCEEKESVLMFPSHCFNVTITEWALIHTEMPCRLHRTAGDPHLGEILIPLRRIFVW